MDFCHWENLKGSSDSKSSARPTFTGCILKFITLNESDPRRECRFQSPSKNMSTRLLYKDKNSFIKLPFAFVYNSVLALGHKNNRLHHPT